MLADTITRLASFADLDARTLYLVLKLRADVFVVEQQDPYPELDGRDLEPGTRHLWLEQGGEPIAYLRILEEPDGSARIGRVVVAEPHRGLGLAADLMTAALRHVGARRCVLGAQSHLAEFYARHGFVVSGREYMDGRIPHVPMVREPNR